jgi:hypothetical protein
MTAFRKPLAIIRRRHSAGSSVGLAACGTRGDRRMSQPVSRMHDRDQILLSIG